MKKINIAITSEGEILYYLEWISGIGFIPIPKEDYEFRNIDKRMEVKDG